MAIKLFYIPNRNTKRKIKLDQNVCFHVPLYKKVKALNFEHAP